MPRPAATEAQPANTDPSAEPAPAPALGPELALDLGPLAVPVRRSLNGEHPGELGTALPPLVDHHVHLELVGAAALVGSGIAAVVDLGANPAVIARTARHGVPLVRFAGQFLTPPGGYPGDRSWLRPGSLREVELAAARVPDLEADAAPGAGPAAADAHPAALPDAVELAVAEQVSFGASVIKVMLNSDAGPVFDAATLSAIVAAAHSRGLPVAVHTEGAGMVELALEAGADALVHTPWTDELDEATIARAAASQVWISTLEIHAIREAASTSTSPDTAPGAAERARDTPELTRAIDNLARFAAAGGRVIYGTDLGNGELPEGVNAREVDGLVRGGLAASAVLEAITDPWPLAHFDDWRSGGLQTFVPGPTPTTPAMLGTWLATARIVPTEELEAL